MDRAPTFERIEQLRAHEYVAEQLRRHIGLGIVGAGEPLPPERELAKMFGVGRATIQHALDLLEADGLIESRRGRSGGTFVIGVRRDHTGLRRLLVDVRRSREEIEEALVYRRIVEEAAAELAARVATPEELEAMQAANLGIRVAESDEEAHRHDTEFHLAVARASHNALLYEGVEQSRLLLNSAILAQPETPRWHDQIEAEHEALIDAIRAQDAGRARREMAGHLRRAEQGIRALLVALR